MYTIETNSITKNFDNIVAVNNINISINQGELLGILGPNGAGKTTLINMLSTMTKPSKGTAKICGFDVVKDASSVRQNIGVVFQDFTLDDRLTGRENLDLHGRLYGINSKIRKKRIEEVLTFVELTDRADSIVKTYSGGMKRRLEIARGFIHKPRVLFLDEPTIGLDPQTRIRVWEYIKTLIKEEGTTIVLTTHYMEEADHLCDRVAIIDHGDIVVIDTPEKLKNMLGGDVVVLKLKDSNERSKLFDIYKDNFTNIVQRDDEIVITVGAGERQIPKILNLALNVEVLSVSLHKPTLDDVFIYHTGHAIRDKNIQ